MSCCTCPSAGVLAALGTVGHHPSPASSPLAVLGMRAMPGLFKHFNVNVQCLADCVGPSWRRGLVHHTPCKQPPSPAPLPNLTSTACPPQPPPCAPDSHRAAAPRNLEKVWKKEQEAEAEKKRTEELRKQYEDERKKNEFVHMGQQAGLGA